MPKVLCTLPNASAEISGVKFVSHANGMLSEDISDDKAQAFVEIPGYELVGATKPADDGAAKKAADDAKKAAEEAAEKAERDDLVARGEAAGLTVKSNWGLPRLRTEVEAAEKDAADKAVDTKKAEADAVSEQK